MAKEKVYGEVLNLRIDEAMSQEITRIAGQEQQAESETARSLIDWGIEAHRAREAALLQQRYDAGTPTDEYGNPMMLRVVAQWVRVEY
jgi:aminoglycoside phosphotransferase family enzyme